MSINLSVYLDLVFFPVITYSTVKQSYIGPCVDLARDNVRLLLSTMEEDVPITQSLVPAVQGAPEEDITKLPEEDAIGHVIAAPLVTETVLQQFKKPGPLWHKVISAQIGSVFARDLEAKFTDKRNQRNRAAASQDFGIRRAPSSTVSEEEKLRAANLYRDKKSHVVREGNKLVKSLAGDSTRSVGQPCCVVKMPITVIVFIRFVVCRVQPPLLQRRDLAMGA